MKIKMDYFFCRPKLFRNIDEIARAQEARVDA